MKSSKFATWALVGGLIAGLIGCGGGNGPSKLEQPVPEKDLVLSLSFDSPQVITDGRSTVTLTADVRDKATNGVVADQPVVFSVDSGRLSAATVSTDAGGTATTVFDSKANKSNRTVVVTAKAGSATVTAKLQVLGTSIVFGGSPSTVVGEATDIVVSVLDGAGTKVPFAELALSASGGGLDQTAVKTDSTGNATVKFSATTSGVATITASGMGATNSTKVTVSGLNFKFRPLASSTVTIDTCTVLRVDLLGSAEPVGFATTRGTLHTDAACASTGTTSVTGVPLVGGTATVYTKSSQAGSASVQAYVAGASTIQNLNYVSVTPTSLQISASPTTVAIGGDTEVRAIVRDAKGNPVENQQVFFSSTGASPFPQIATTNSSGVAVSKFTADKVPSGQGAVEIKAEMPAFALNATSSLTISGSPVQVSIGLNDKLEVIESPPTYRYVMSVTVKDSNGSPVPGQLVTMSLAIPEYGKGTYKYETGKTEWVQNYAAKCDAEDPNGNGVVDPGEIGDVNGNRVLDPQNGTTIRAANATSVGNTFNVKVGDDGRAAIWLEYPKSEASWLKVDVSATASVSGQNAVAHSMFYTTVPSDVIKNKDVTPAFAVSPFGTSSSCTNPN